MCDFQIDYTFFNSKSSTIKTEKNMKMKCDFNRELILLPYIYTHAQIIGKLVDSIMNSPVPKKLKSHFTVTGV